MRKKIYKLAVIGGSVDSAVGYTHLIASQMDHRFELVAACFSRNPQTNQKTVEAWNLERVKLYDDWNKLLLEEKNNIDAVAVLTPTPLHFEMVTQALIIGIPTICEKAMASSYQEAIGIYDTQEKTNGFLAITHNYTGYPMLRELRGGVRSGNIGRITQIQIEMPQEGFARLDMSGQKPRPQNWRLVDGKIPSISLDLGTHLQHMIHYVTGKNPASLVAEQSTYGWFKDVIDDVSIIARYPCGMKSSMWYGKAALGHRNGLKLRIYGTKASAEWFQMDPETLILHDIHGNRKILDRAGDAEVGSIPRYNRFKSGHPAGFIEAYANLYVDIADEMDKYHKTGFFDSDWTYGAKQAAAGLNVFEKADASSKSRAWVDLE